MERGVFDPLVNWLSQASNNVKFYFWVIWLLMLTLGFLFVLSKAIDLISSIILYATQFYKAFQISLRWITKKCKNCKTNNNQISNKRGLRSAVALV
ncbi:pAG2 [Santa barbara virus]|uniref:PAG2 n=1 Tax=Santa barbara virus TaxID=1552661 RepID=A0A097A5A1_9RHAB|nr:pAG2 [Santa barbara virus]AIS40849.1 pAG2 [Santa barbara virus]